MFAVFVIAVLGYALGRITIKGVSLGTAGVFIVALLFGALFSETLSGSVVQTINGSAADISGSALKIIENIGLILFVTSVGFIAGPSFFKDLKKNFKSYILLGVVIIFSGGLTCLGCYLVGSNFTDLSGKEFMAICVGLLSGALTSTPAFSASKATVAPELEELVTVGNGIAYIFGVIGVVLFVQLVPKFVKADMDKDRSLLMSVDVGEKKEYSGKLINIDAFGLAAFGLATVIGILVVVNLSM